MIIISFKLWLYQTSQPLPILLNLSIPSSSSEYLFKPLNLKQQKPSSPKPLNLKQGTSNPLSFKTLNLKQHTSTPSLSYLSIKPLSLKQSPIPNPPPYLPLFVLSISISPIICFTFYSLSSLALSCSCSCFCFRSPTNGVVDQRFVEVKGSERDKETNWTRIGVGLVKCFPQG